MGGAVAAPGADVKFATLPSLEIQVYWMFGDTGEPIQPCLQFLALHNALVFKYK